ncbi:hypothetical protein Tco_0639004, partial [Tanacetum coccineum]
DEETENQGRKIQDIEDDPLVSLVRESMEGKDTDFVISQKAKSTDKEQQKKRKADVQEVAQYYTEEDWDTIRAKLEANAELTKSLQGESMTSEDFAKRMTEFEKLVKSIENFVPVKTDERLTRQGVQLEQEFSKKQKTIEEVSVLEESITEPVIAKEEEIEKSVKKREEREAFIKDKVSSTSSESEIGIEVIPTATKPDLES